MQTRNRNRRRNAMQTSDHGSAYRVLFVTLGGAPRVGLISDIVTQLPENIDVQEMGLLDPLDESEIAALAARADETSVVAYLHGREMVLSRHKLARLAFDTIAALQPNSFDLAVLLSTGILREFESTCPMVNGQRAVDSAIISIAAKGEKVGLVVPLRRHVNELDIPALSLFHVKIAHARQSSPDEMRWAATELEHCDYIVLNSVGYDEDDKRLMAELTGKPILLARQIITSSVLFILNATTQRPISRLPASLQERLDELTPRERQVMTLVCEGLSSKAVARQLNISPRTVEIHRSSVLRKMQVQTSSALIRLMLGIGRA